MSRRSRRASGASWPRPRRAGSSATRRCAHARRCPRPTRCRCFRDSRSGSSRSSARSGRCSRAGCAAGSSSAVSTCAILSLGVRDVDGLGRYVTPYRFLFDFVPGWDGVRAPGRINTLTSLGLALLAGAGLCVVVRGLRGRGTYGRGRRGRARHRRRPRRGTGAAHASRCDTASRCGPRRARTADPSAADQDSQYSYWSTAGFPKIVNGFGGLRPVRVRPAAQ